MRTLFAVLAAVTILAGGMLGNRAEAMTPATPLALGVATAALVQKAAVVCGNAGCVPVQTSRVRRHRTHP